MSSIGYFEKVRRAFYEYSRTLSADDPRFKRSIKITHYDGTDVLDNAFLLRYAGPDGKVPCIIVISEHYGVRVYPKDDLQNWAQYERIEIEDFPTLEV